MAEHANNNKKYPSTPNEERTVFGDAHGHRPAKYGDAVAESFVAGRERVHDAVPVRQGVVGKDFEQEDGAGACSALYNRGAGAGDHKGVVDRHRAPEPLVGQRLPAGDEAVGGLYAALMGGVQHPAFNRSAKITNQ